MSALSDALFISQERVSFFTRNDQVPRRSGLGLFLHYAGIKGDASKPKGPVFARSRIRGTGQGDGENYAWMGQHWPDSRYVVIGLSFDMLGEDVPGPWIEDWRCLYDLKTGAFSVPPDFADNNAKAVKYPQSK
jgi:hypothetical protein